MACAVGAERKGDVNTVTEKSDCTVTWKVKLEASSEEEVVLGGFSNDVCCMCGRRFAFQNRQTEHFIKHNDEVSCHFCQMKFTHMNSLAFHLKNAHPKYHMFCKICSIYMGRHVPMEWTVETVKTPIMELLDEEVEEVIIEHEEVEIKYEGVKEEEEEEEVVGWIEETKENSITDTPEDNKKFNSNLHDHTYFSTQTCSSLRETTNNVIMYTSSENVLVFINKTDTGISPKDSYTESDHQGTSVDEQMLCGVIHDHTYFSTQSLANSMPTAKQVSDHNTCGFLCKTANNVMNSSTENIHVFNNKSDTSNSPEDTENIESDQDQIWKHDHSYFSSANCANWEFEPIQENAVIGENEESIWTSDYEDSDSLPAEDLVCKHKDDLFTDTMDSDALSIDGLVYTFQDDLSSDTVSCTSTYSNGDTLEEDCKNKSWSTCLKQNCENTNQKSLGSVGSLTSNSATSLYKDLEFCPSCGLSKVPDTKKSMEWCTCTPFTCPLCRIVFGTEEMLLNHLAEKHPLEKYMCVSCLRLFPNQKIFIQHICSSSKGFNGESLTPSKSSNNAKEPLHMILNFVSSPAAAESCKQSFSSQRLSNVNTTLNLGTVLNSTSHSLPKSPSTCYTQKVPVQVMTTRSASCAQEKKMICLVLNGDQGQVTTLVSTVTPKQIGQMQGLSPLQTKGVTQTSSSSSSPSSSSSSSSSSPSSSSSSSPPPSAQILLLSSQGQGQITPISAVPQTKSGQMQDLTSLQSKVLTHTTTGNAELKSRIVLPQQHPSFGAHLPPPVLSQVSSSVSIPSQTGQLLESSVPFLDVCRSSTSPKILPSSQGPLKIVAMFVNQSKELALQKRMRQSWRSKAVIPCRQCGAVSRQFSLGVRHRYQHRGPRIHRCQCGRTFQQRMHLLRHQVQHAEATRYVCAACGQMFCGMQQLARHRPLFRITPSNTKKRANKECRNKFQCYCGHTFTRPAALLWHMLKNSKARKPRLKGFRVT